MNDQVQNINTTTPSAPVSVIVFDKEGNPLPVKPIGPNEVQDVEYSDTPEGN